MYDENIQSVLRCRLCNKPFDQQSTLKRHGYYCRSRKSGSVARVRSCISCARRKLRCDTGQPECSRCTAKGIACQYLSTSQPTGSRIEHDDHRRTERGETATSCVASSSTAENHQESNRDGTTISDNTLITFDEEFAALRDDYLDWDAIKFDLDGVLDSHTREKTTQDLALGSSSSMWPPTPLSHQRALVTPSVSSLILPIVPGPSSNVRLMKRPKREVGRHRITMLICHTLKSYPMMMLRHSPLPPFIRPRLISSDSGESDMQPILNCISLVHMINSKASGSGKLFWRNVRSECEHLLGKRIESTRWELLAGLQAVFIYIMIRLTEGVKDYNNVDSLLVSTVAMISDRLNSIDIIDRTEAALGKFDLESAWKDWLFQESGRRISVAYQALNMLIYFDPADICHMETELVLEKLPAKKQLWEAEDEHMWKAEIMKEPGIQTAYGLAANGELVKVEELGLGFLDSVRPVQPSASQTPPESDTNWEEWCSGMDGLGGLVMLIASLIA